ncbi:MAG TPA: transposase [Vicinamibacterales bacterium]|jgi:REP element-mobilizing transposase RayT|nr:transposase [Vicinamibacterales bacterium]
MSHPARLSPSSYVGRAPIFLTICTRLRQRYFEDRDTATFVRDEILSLACLHRVDVLVYCLMPDHLHALVSGKETDSDLPRLVHAIKQRTSSRFKQTHGAPLWQPSFFDRTLRPDEDVRRVMHYIIMNPVRAGLVRELDDYPLWGSSVLTRTAMLDAIGEVVSWS